MGNPLRFFGSDEPIEIDGVVIPPNCAVEVTFRTHQQQFLLRPDDEAREILLGCFGRAQDRYPGLNLIVINILSNHGSFLALPESSPILSNFMRDFLSTAATRLNKLRKRSGTFWERRFRAIPVVDEQALDNRFAYILTQGTKENLVYDAGEWPGVSSIGALTGKGGLIGRWRDAAQDYEKNRQRTRRLARAAVRGRLLEIAPPEPTWISYPIEHVPMPHWVNLEPEERIRRVTAILATDAQSTRKRHRRDGTRPLGCDGILRVRPTECSKNPKKSPAPFVHASSKQMALAFREAARRYSDGLASCVVKSRKFVRASGLLPSGATLPPSCPSFVRATPASSATTQRQAPGDPSKSAGTQRPVPRNSKSRSATAHT